MVVKKGKSGVEKVVVGKDLNDVGGLCGEDFAIRFDGRPSFFQVLLSRFQFDNTGAGVFRFLCTSAGLLLTTQLPQPLLDLNPQLCFTLLPQILLNLCLDFQFHDKLPSRIPDEDISCTLQAQVSLQCREFSSARLVFLGYVYAFCSNVAPTTSTPLSVFCRRIVGGGERAYS